MKRTETAPPSAIPLALAQLIERMTPEEKREFAMALDWEELQRLRVEAIGRKWERRVGDPRIYVGTTASGLSLELPLGCILPFVSSLPRLLAVEQVNLFVQNNQGSKEYCFAADELEDWLAGHPSAWQHETIMIELGPHTLTSGGGGCLSLALEDVSPVTLREIAQQALRLCGYDYEFHKGRFSAVVWEDQLEVME